VLGAVSGVFGDRRAFWAATKSALSLPIETTSTSGFRVLGRLGLALLPGSVQGTVVGRR
jgi:hypothetical protein